MENLKVGNFKANSIFMSFTLMIFTFQNCGPAFQTKSVAFETSLGTNLVHQSSVSLAPAALAEPTELQAGDQVKWLGVFSTSPLSNESVDPDRFRQLLDELQGRTNVVDIMYLSDELLSVGYAKGLDSKRKLSALELLNQKLNDAEARGFSVAIGVSAAFFNYDVDQLRFNLESLKESYLTEWQSVSKVLKMHSNIKLFYPLDEPYWNAKNANVSFSRMKIHLDTMNSLIKRDFPASKIVFIEAYTMIDEDFQVPRQSDYIGIDCYGNFENCYGQSIPSYYKILEKKMHKDQKFILVPDAFGIASPGAPADSLNQVVAQSKKYLEFSRQNPRVEGLIFFFYNTPLDRSLNPENMIAIRQSSALGAYFDQVGVQNQKILGPSPVLNPSINLSFLDHDRISSSVEATQQTPDVFIQPAEFFDISFVRPLGLDKNFDCLVIDPLGQTLNCKEIFYRQTRFSTQSLSKGTWRFQFQFGDQKMVERRITLLEDAPEQSPTISVQCNQLKTGELAQVTCRALVTGKIQNYFWRVAGRKQDGSDNRLSFTWSDLRPGTYSGDFVAEDRNGNQVTSPLVTVQVQ